MHPFIALTLDADTVCPQHQAILFDSEGKSALEVSVAIVKGGELVTSKRFLLQPTLPLLDEEFGIRNLHGLDYEHCLRYGLTAMAFVDQFNAFMLEHLDPIPTGHKLNLYIAGEVGAGDKRILALLNLPYVTEPITIALPPWKLRVHQAYFKDYLHENVRLCHPLNHSAYRPYALDPSNSANINISGTDLAKLSAGYHCSSLCIVRLYRYMKVNKHFD
jgi:hypothetical protein